MTCPFSWQKLLACSDSHFAQSYGCDFDVHILPIFREDFKPRLGEDGAIVINAGQQCQSGNTGSRMTQKITPC